MNKICLKCNKEKDILEFRGTRNTCYECEKLQTTQYRKNNPKKKLKKIISFNMLKIERKIYNEQKNTH